MAWSQRKNNGPRRHDPRLQGSANGLRYKKRLTNEFSQTYALSAEDVAEVVEKRTRLTACMSGCLPAGKITSQRRKGRLQPRRNENRNVSTEGREHFFFRFIKGLIQLRSLLFFKGQRIVNSQEAVTVAGVDWTRPVATFHSLNYKSSVPCDSSIPCDIPEPLTVSWSRVADRAWRKLSGRKIVLSIHRIEYTGNTFELDARQMRLSRYQVLLFPCVDAPDGDIRVCL